MDGEGIWHGGSLGAARRLFPDAPEPWIDLSTGINPVPYAVPPLSPDLWTRLPEPGAQAALEAVARAAYGAGEGVDVLAAPGTQILIGLLPTLLSPRRVAILGPTYAEHAAAWRAGGHRVAEVADLAAAEGADVVVLVNPNNPDGRLVAPATLSAFAQAHAGLLVVDEAFADLEPGASICPQLPADTIVLRSFGKTYGLAGLRLGFALGLAGQGDALVARMRELMGPWAVSGPACAIGAAALADRDWLARTAAARAADAARLDALLAPHARAPMRGTRLYRLLESEDASALFARLGRAGLYVRRFDHDPRLLRFGLPASEEAFGRLERTLVAAL